MDILAANSPHDGRDSTAATPDSPLTAPRMSRPSSDGGRLPDQGIQGALYVPV